MTSKRSQSGHTLVELMVAMGLGVLIFSAIISLHYYSLKATKLQQLVELKINTLRQSLELIKIDIGKTGMTHCLLNDDLIRNRITDRSNTNSNPLHQFWISGYSNNGWKPDPPYFNPENMHSENDALNINFVDMSENLTIRQIQSDRHRIVFVSDCRLADISRSTNSLLLNSNNSDTTLHIHPYQSVVYYLKEHAMRTSLYRQYLTKSGKSLNEPLIDNVSQLKFAYAEKLSDSTLSFHSAASVLSWKNIVAIYVFIEIVLGDTSHSLSMIVPILNHDT